MSFEPGFTPNIELATIVAEIEERCNDETCGRRRRFYKSVQKAFGTAAVCVAAVTGRRRGPTDLPEYFPDYLDAPDSRRLLDRLPGFPDSGFF